MYIHVQCKLKHFRLTIVYIYIEKLHTIKQSKFFRYSYGVGTSATLKILLTISVQHENIFLPAQTLKGQLLE